MWQWAVALSGREWFFKFEAKAKIARAQQKRIDDIRVTYSNFAAPFLIFPFAALDFIIDFPFLWLHVWLFFLFHISRQMPNAPGCRGIFFFFFFSFLLALMLPWHVAVLLFWTSHAFLSEFVFLRRVGTVDCYF